MEGLIPMVYKSLMNNKKRLNYEYLSSGAAQDDDDNDYDHHRGYLGRKQQHHLIVLPEAHSVPGANHHRRYNSVDASIASEDDDAYKPKQLVRFRSHRMFACITGA